MKITIVGTLRKEPPALVHYQGAVYYRTGIVGYYQDEGDEFILHQYRIRDEYMICPHVVWTYSDGTVVHPSNVTVGL